MELFGNLAILNPLVLAGLLSLPVIWWLLRVLPPSPQRVRFPALVFLRDLKDEERDTAHTPWWLLLLRLVLAALFIGGLAGPVLNRNLEPVGNGPLVVMIDDSWAAAGHWEQRLSMASSLIRQAGETARPIALVTTAPRLNPDPITLMTADQARARLSSLQPRPVRPDRLAAADRIRDLKDFGRAEIVWLSDGLENGQTDDLVTKLRSAARLILVTDRAEDHPLGLTIPEIGGSELQVQVIRSTGLETPASGFVEAHGGDGQTERLIARQPFTLDPGKNEIDITFDLPLDLANQVTRLNLANQATSGAVALLDDRWRRQRIGLVSGRSIEAAQPLLSDLYYLERAVSTRAVVQRGSVASLTASPEPPIAIILADVGRLSPDEGASLDDWINRGGLLIRFAGPRLAALASAPLEEAANSLLPVRLRAGGRALGGALTWQTPQHLAPYPEASPFAGLPLPDDVAISRQVLAEPDPSLAEKTWARLTDGTPLVTSVTRGRGRIVLVHVTANPQWSSLPLSGLYPDMLKRMLDLAPGLTVTTNAVPSSGPATSLSQPNSGMVRPVRLLDGFGRWVEPQDQRPIVADRLAQGTRAGVLPGLYEGTRPNSSRAVNMLDGAEVLTPLPASLPVSSRVFYAQAPEIEFAPWLLLAASILLVLDTLISLGIRGLLSGRTSTTRKAAVTAGALALIILPVLVFTPSGPARAQSNTSAEAIEEQALQAALTTRLGYIRTGDRRVDRLSEAGLSGLTRIIGARTAIEAGPPMGLDPETDELVFFPLIYWPVLAEQPELSPAALQKVDRYLKHGGVILFDTRDEQSAPVFQVGGGVTPALAALRRLIGGLDLPPLEPVPQDHVLTRAFYLLQTFPGRWTGGEVWVEASSMTSVPFEEQDTPSTLTSDGVSPIIIGSHDWAAAWAIDEAGRPLAELVPGGVRQRELAFRFGVNLVMYALTGNYKTDQVHIPALLERLGQ